MKHNMIKIVRDNEVRVTHNFTIEHYEHLQLAQMQNEVSKNLKNEKLVNETMNCAEKLVAICKTVECKNFYTSIDINDVIEISVTRYGYKDKINIEVELKKKK